MRLLFIEPKVNNPIRSNIALPVTYLCLYSFIKKKLPTVEFLYHSIEIDHVEDKNTDYNSIYQKYQPDIVLSTSVTCNFYSAIDILDYFRGKGCFTVFGGLFATANDEFILKKYNCIDVIIRGEGEITLYKLLRSLIQKKIYKLTNGISIMNSGNFIRNKDRPVISNINILPKISYDNIPIKILRRNRTRYYIFASRGCSYNCIFCTLTSHWQRKHRLFSHDRVISEIDSLISIFDPVKISFGDDTLGLDNPYFIRLCDKLANKKFPTKFGGKIRIDLVSPELLFLMKNAGFDEISFGIESDNKQQLILLNKKQIYKNISSIDSILKIASDFGFRINMNFILGVPGETDESLERKAEFIIKKCAKPNVIPLLGFLTPHQGTSIHANLEKFGVEITDYNLNHYNHLQPVCAPHSLGENAINKLIVAYNRISSETSSEEYNPLIKQ